MKTIGIAFCAALSLAGTTAWAADPFAWMPPGAPALQRGRQVADRFDLLATWEVTVEIDNAFSQANRRALIALERRLTGLTGVRRVLGPARLLTAAVDAAGNVMTRSLFDATAGATDADAESEAVRQQVGRRADAAGWFISGDGRTARFLIDTLDMTSLRPALTDALSNPPSPSSSSLPFAIAAVWPNPRDASLTWIPLVIVAAWIAFLWIVGAPAWRGAGALTARGAVAVVLAAAVGAAAPFALAALAPLRGLGGRLALTAAVTTGLALLIDRLAHRRAAGAFAAWQPLRAPPFAVLLAALVAAAGIAVVANPRLGRLRLATQQWRTAPLLLVSVRADIDQPVVLRELRRLTDFLRAEPGVAAAWSVADLFEAVDQPGDDVSRIPDSADDVRRLLSQAHADPAVRLELSGDHREALVAIRFDADADTEVDRAAVLDRLARYLDGDLRAALLRVDLREPGPAATRALAQGLLANDATERIERICARAGRNLGDPERQAIERVARRAALIPIADAGRLHAEIAADLRAFLRLRAPPMTATERNRVATALAVLDADWSVGAVWAALGGVFAPGRSDGNPGRVPEPSRDGLRSGQARALSTHPPAALGALVPALARQLGTVRLRHAARIYEREMLAGAALPTEGALADQVRAATREAMGPVVGLPVARQTAGAFLLDAVVVGGAANDRALSIAWLPGLRKGAIAGAVGLAIILVLVAGLQGVLWYPLALALPSAALFLPALTRDPVGALFVEFLAGAAAAGGVLATSLAARHRP